MSYVLNIKNGENILEPSAGTGNLAVWAKTCSDHVLVNEIDERRSKLLRHIGFAPTNFNAEFINDYLTPDIEIDIVMMNPPFSASRGRTRNSSNYGFRHIESALARIKKGGRFGVILGAAGGIDTKSGRQFWYKLLDEFELKSNFKLSGKEYYKNGTAVDVNLIFGHKFIEPLVVDRHHSLNEVPFYYFKTVEEAFCKIEEHELRFQ